MSCDRASGSPYAGSAPEPGEALVVSPLGTDLFFTVLRPAAPATSLECALYKVLS